MRLPTWAARAAELAEAGWTRSAIGKEVDVSLPRVSTVLRRMGFPQGQPGQPRKSPKPEPRRCRSCGSVFIPDNAGNPGVCCNRQCANEAKTKLATDRKGLLSDEQFLRACKELLASTDADADADVTGAR